MDRSARPMMKALCEEAPWLKVFEASVDDVIAGAAKQIDLTPPAHEPLLVEQLLDDVSELLQRCLAYRREAQELEVVGLKAALDARLFKATKRAEMGWASGSLRAAELLKEAEYQRLAADAFAAVAAKDALAEGLKNQAKGDGEVAAITATKERERQGYLEERWTALQEHQDALNDRFANPGNAYNFNDRVKRIMRFLRQDFREAYEKAGAAAVGLEVVYGITEPKLPKQDSPQLLDEFVNWAREVIPRIERLMENDVEQHLIVPLTEPWGPSGATPLVKPERLKAAMADAGDGRVEFDLGKVFEGDAHVRLRSVGLAFGYDFVEDERLRLAWQMLRFRCRVLTPAASGREGIMRRPTLVLGDVGPFGSGHAVSTVGGSACQNVDPRGTWSITVDPHAVTLMGNGGPVRPKILDLKLFLGVVSHPKK